MVDTQENEQLLLIRCHFWDALITSDPTGPSTRLLQCQNLVAKNASHGRVQHRVHSPQYLCLIKPELGQAPAGRLCRRRRDRHGWRCLRRCDQHWLWRCCRWRCCQCLLLLLLLLPFVALWLLPRCQCRGRRSGRRRRRRCAGIRGASAAAAARLAVVADPAPQGLDVGPHHEEAVPIARVAQVDLQECACACERE